MKKVKFRFLALAALVFSLMCAGTAFAEEDGVTKTLTISDLGESGYTQPVADWPNEQDGKKSLSKAVTIKLDENVQGLAKSGELVYNFQMSASCDECRTFDWSSSVVFKDVSKTEISRWSEDDDDYSTYRQSHTLGDSGIVPADTVYIEVTSKCSVGTSSDLTLDSDIAFTTTANIDPSANGNSYVGTVIGEDFSSSDGSTTSLSQSFYYDYLKDDTCYADDVDFVATVYLDPQAKELADQGMLYYTASVTSSCGECRTMHNKMSARCFDANNKELSAGQWVVSETDYETFPQDKTYQSGTIFIPEGTAYMMLDASNEMTSTNSHLGLYGSLTVTCVKSPIPWDDNVDEEGNPLFEPSFTVVNATDGQTLAFTDVFSGYSKRVSADDRETLFRSAIFNQGVLFNWGQFAYDVIKAEGAYWDHSDSGFDSAFGSGHYTDLLYQFTHQTDGSVSGGPKDSNAWASSTGLMQANSMTDVINAATDELAAQRKKMSSRSFGKCDAADFRDYHDIQGALNSKYGEGMHDLSSIEGPLFYSIVTTTDQRGAEQYYYYNSFALVFYDFEFAGVADSTTYTMEPASSSNKPVAIVQSVTNDNPTASSLTSSYSHTDSSTATNTITSSSTVTMGQSYGIEGSASGKFDIKLVEANIAFKASEQWSLTDAFTFSESKSQSETVSESVGSSSTTEVPPYSIGTEVTTTSVSTVSQEYDCPIAVRYKVMLFALDGKYYDDGVGVCDFVDYTHDTFVAAVGYDVTGDAGGSSSVSAQDALRNDFASTRLDEAALNALGVPTTKYCKEDANLKAGTALLSALKTNIPCVYEDAVYADTATSVDYTVNVYPTRPLAFTAVTSVSSKFLEKDNTIYVTENASYDLSNNIGVAGYVAASDSTGASAKYTGFSMSNGGWKVYMADGSPVDASVAEVVKNDVSGHTMLKLGNVDKATALLLVYHINDGVYSYITSPNQTYGENGYTNDADLLVRASLNVMVQPTDAVSADESDLAQPEAGEGEADAGAAGEGEVVEGGGTENAGEAMVGESNLIPDPGPEPGPAPSFDPGDLQPVAPSSTYAAFAEAAMRLNHAWAVYVATYGYVDRAEPISEQQLTNMMYAAYCVVMAQPPAADPRAGVDMEAFAAEAQAWAEKQGFDSAYENGADTYGDAIDIIMNHLRSMLG